MKYNKNQRSNINNVALNRFDNDVPREMWFTEGPDFVSIKPKLAPYDINIYKAIEYAIQQGIIDTGSQSKGTYANDEAAILGGLLEGDIYELSEDNTLDSTFYGLLKVVKQNEIIMPQVLGTGETNTVIGTGVPGQIIGI
jgi:hypothetical protein